MTGFKSKRAAALDEDGMYLVHQTTQPDTTMQSLKDLKRSVCDGVGKAAFAQPEQEPVAWAVFEGNLHDMFFTQEEAQEMADLKGTHAEVRPLYTQPPAPQRPWVDLTDEEIQDCDPHEDCWHLFKIARAVLAKSKEKNNG